MAASGADSAKGTVLVRNTYIIGEVSNITGVGLSTDTVEVTHYASDDGYKEFVQTFRDGGEVTLEGNLEAADTNGQMAIDTDMNAGTRQSWRVIFPVLAVADWNFYGIVTAYESTQGADGVIGFTTTIKITSKPTMNTTANAGLTTPYFSIDDNSDNTVAPSPAAASGTYDYTATALTGATSVNVTVTATAGTIYVDGTEVATTEESGSITLGDAGTETEVYIWIYEASKCSKVYWINILRAAS